MRRPKDHELRKLEAETEESLVRVFGLLEQLFEEGEGLDERKVRSSLERAYAQYRVSLQREVERELELVK